jgi:hypothetical protein
MKSLHFESIKKTIPKYKAFSISMLGSEHDYALENPTRMNQCM